MAANPSDHNIVQKTDKISDTILYHNGYCNCKYHFVKGLISQKFLPESRLSYCVFHLSISPFISKL